MLHWLDLYAGREMSSRARPLSEHPYCYCMHSIVQCYTVLLQQCYSLPCTSVRRRTKHPHARFEDPDTDDDTLEASENDPEPDQKETKTNLISIDLSTNQHADEKASSASPTKQNLALLVTIVS